jgi:hypothetical protein
MACSHNFVEGKPFLIPHMALDAQLSPFFWLFSRVKAEIKVLLVSDLARNMGAKVAIPATVTRFAADPVIDIETLSAERYRHIVRMAIETDLGGFWRLWKP